jgi:hypothetical protein
MFNAGFSLVTSNNSPDNVELFFCRWDVEKKNQFHFHVIVPFVTTQIYWTLRTFVLCRWPIATPSVDLFYNADVEDRQLDVPGIPAHSLFHCKWFWCYDKWCLSLLRTPSVVYDKHMYSSLTVVSVWKLWATLVDEVRPEKSQMTLYWPGYNTSNCFFLYILSRSAVCL